MADPISSRLDDPYRPYSSNDDEEPLCKEPSSTSSVDRSHATALSNPSALRTPTHAEHGVATMSAGAHAAPDDIYAGAFALKGRDAHGPEMEVFSVSGHADAQQAIAQIAMARMGASTEDRHWGARAEAFTAQMDHGHDNADGSTGYHAGFGYTVVGAELTGTLGPLSLTGAVSVGTTFGISVGIRDSDHDGRPEICERVDFGAGAIGFCLEDRQ